MPNPTQRLIYPWAEKAFEALHQAVEIFDGTIAGDPDSPAADYYKARNLVREGESQIKQALNNARKLLGPLPGYVTDDYRAWRERFVEEHRILAEGEDKGELRADLVKDEFVSRWISEEDIDRLLDLNYGAQQEGKRRIAHIKIRIIMDSLFELQDKARELQKKALQNIQGG